MKVEYAGWSALLCILFASLSGCTTAQSVRNRPANKVVYVVGDNYQAICRQLLHRAREYESRAAPPALGRVDYEIWTDIKEASLALIVSEAPFTETYWVIDLKALDDEQTQATLYIKSPAAGRVLQQWVAELGGKCVSPE